MTAATARGSKGRGATFAIMRVTLLEAASRKLALWALGLSVVFLALFWVGFSLLVSRSGEFDTDNQAAIAAMSSILTLLGMYIVSFLACFMALMLSAASVSSEADAGTLQAVLARPLRRGSWLLQRWAALALLVAVYAMVMGGALLLISRLVAGHDPIDAGRALVLLAAQTVAVLTLGLVASTRLSTVAAGVVGFSMFGLAWLGGIIEFIGDVVANEAMQNAGIAVSLVMPSDMLWRASSFYLQAPLFVQQAAGAGGLPFGSTTPPAAASLWWAAGWALVLLAIAVRHFERRDL